MPHKCPATPEESDGLRRSPGLPRPQLHQLYVAFRDVPPAIANAGAPTSPVWSAKQCCFRCIYRHVNEFSILSCFSFPSVVKLINVSLFGLNDAIRFVGRLAPEINLTFLALAGLFCGRRNPVCSLILLFSHHFCLIWRICLAMTAGEVVFLVDLSLARSPRVSRQNLRTGLRWLCHPGRQISHQHTQRWRVALRRFSGRPLRVRNGAFGSKLFVRGQKTVGFRACAAACCLLAKARTGGGFRWMFSHFSAGLQPFLGPLKQQNIFHLYFKAV